jgi:hypothetical protein
MRNIIIVEAASTGLNYIHDIISRGFNPIVLTLKFHLDTQRGRDYKEYIENDLNSVEYDFERINEKDSYEETLEMVRAYSPLLVLPGSERGVVLASKLASDLDLLCNPIENLDAMTLKHEMQNRLAENNLRHIRGRVVESSDEAIEFYDENNLKEVVLKPIYSAGSASVRICADKDEMVDSLNELFNNTNQFGDENTKLLVQEKINGDEYIVNTVSCEGDHRVTLVWKYNKVRTAEGGIIYDTCQSVSELNLGEAEMIEYAYKVADALGIQYGPVHGEYMIDEEGPVLIEVNCRPSGGHMDAEFLDRISGQHETDSILDAYLKPELFYEDQKKRYRLFAHGVVKFFIAPKVIFAESAPMNNISIELSSHYKSSLPDSFSENHPFIKTEDLDSSCGFVYLVHENLFEIHKDIKFLRKVESQAFDLVLSENKKDIVTIDEDECLKVSSDLLEKSEIYGTTLFVTDQKLDRPCMQVSADEISDLTGTHDCVIVNLNLSLADKSGEEISRIFLEIFKKVKVGGFIFIPKTTYDCLRSKRNGMEALLKTLNLRIEVPPYGVKGVIIASKT